MSKKRELLGRPISGEFNPSYNPPQDQRPDSEFIEELDKLFDNHLIKDVSWMQYTPYFNDGEPCVFSVHDPYFGLNNLTEEQKSSLEDNSDYGDARIASWSLKYLSVEDLGLNDQATLDSLKESFANFSGLGGFEILLQKTFGDHAQVIATREGFDVESYDHD